MVKQLKHAKNAMRFVPIASSLSRFYRLNPYRYKIYLTGYQ